MNASGGALATSETFSFTTEDALCYYCNYYYDDRTEEEWTECGWYSTGPIYLARCEGPSTFVLQAPQNGSSITTLTPALGWSRSMFATSYRVDIIPLGGSWATPLISNVVATNQWQVPDGVLARGKTYSWQVTAIWAGKSITAPSSNGPSAFTVSACAGLTAGKMSLFNYDAVGNLISVSGCE